MKPILLFFLVALTISFLNAQSSDFEMFIGGSKSFTSSSNFDSVIVKHKATGKEFLVSNYQWVISTKGTIYKGVYPIDKVKLREVIAKLKPADIIFIETGKADNGRLLVPGQYAFTFE